MRADRSTRVLALAALLLPACAGPSRPVPDVLLIEPGGYGAAFDAAVESARAAGLEPVHRDRAGGVIETAAMPAGSILEPWTGDNATFGQSMENTIAWQRRRARFEFAAAGAGGQGAGDRAAGGGPDVLGLREPVEDLASEAGPVELRVRVFIERARAPGIRRDPWSRALTTRSSVRRGDEPRPPALFWMPVSRDAAFEKRLLGAVQEAVSR